MNVTDMDRLAAVVEHARAHNLTGTVITVGVAGDRVNVYLATRSTSRTSDRDFARWARSIGATEVLDACPTPSRRQFEALGFLDSGHAVTVLVTVYEQAVEPAFRVPLSVFEAGVR